jgi:RNA polymerase sigma-70 factor (ECF subfamily)
MDESALVAGLRRGDDAAYEVLLRTHGPRMLAVARHYLRKREDAEDVVQSAFVLVVRFIGHFHGASRLSTWLHRIVVNTALMQIRSRDRHPEARWDESVTDGGSAASPAAHVEASDREDSSQREVHDRLHLAIGRLPDTARAAVRLHDVDGLTLGETARLLGQSTAAVQTSVRRGRAALRTMLVPTRGTSSVR